MPRFRETRKHGVDIYLKRNPPPRLRKSPSTSTHVVKRLLGMWAGWGDVHIKKKKKKRSPLLASTPVDFHRWNAKVDPLATLTGWTGSQVTKENHPRHPASSLGGSAQGFVTR